MSVVIDLNCDMGEGTSPESAAHDLALMRYVSSCAVACGGHAGTEASMRQTVRNAHTLGLRIGAHPAYPDKAHFGRQTLDIDADQLVASLTEQIQTLRHIAHDEGASLSFIKPHGALYNDMAQEPALARTVIAAFAVADRDLPLMGLAGSFLPSACEASGLGFIAEAFADRRYRDDGQLRSRSLPNAVIDDPQAAAEQSLSLVEAGIVTTDTGNRITVRADSICLHSDTTNALRLAQGIHEYLRSRNVAVASSAQAPNTRHD